MRIAVVGTGSIGRRHLANLLALGARDLIAVSEHGRLSSMEIDGFGISVVNSYDVPLHDPDVAVVVLANPTSFHLDYARRGVVAGKHIYLEKPPAASADGVAELAQEAERRCLIVAIGTQYRFDELLAELRRRLQSGDAGMILSAAAHFGEHIADYHPNEDYRQSYAARAELGGGVLLTQIHQIDYLNWIFGPFDTVFAIGGRRSNLEIDVEDCVSYLLRTAKGLGVYGHINYLERPKRGDLRVTGSKGNFVWDCFANSLAFTPAKLGAKPVLQHSVLDRNALFLAAITDFLDAVRQGGKPRASLQDGCAALRIVDAIKVSYASGTVARIDA